MSRRNRVPSVSNHWSGAGLKLGAILALALFGGSARGELHFTEPRFDAGVVRAGMPLAHSFEFVNEGPDPVEITDLQVGCGCLTPHLEQRTYQAGQQGALVLEVNTLTQPTGPHTWRVDLSYRCGAISNQIPLFLMGKVETEITVEPAVMAFSADRAVTHDVVLTDLRLKSLSITGLRTSSPYLTAVTGEEGRDPGGHHILRIHLSVAEDYSEGRHDEVVVIGTDDRAYPELKVQVTVTKRSHQRLVTLPAEVVLKAAPGQPSPSRIILVQDRENQDVTVEKVEADDPAVLCQWAKGPGTMVTVKVRVDPARLSGPSLQTTVHVHVSKPIVQDLTVPVSCTLP